MFDINYQDKKLLLRTVHFHLMEFQQKNENIGRSLTKCSIDRYIEFPLPILMFKWNIFDINFCGPLNLSLTLYLKYSAWCLVQKHHILRPDFSCVFV